MDQNVAIICYYECVSINTKLEKENLSKQIFAVFHEKQFTYFKKLGGREQFHDVASNRIHRVSISSYVYVHKNGWWYIPGVGP